jgi:hypothetical protein
MSPSTIRDGLLGLVPWLLISAAALATHYMLEAARDEGRESGLATGRAELAELRSQYAAERAKAADQELADAKAAAKREQEQAKRADELASQLVQQQRDHRTTTDRLSGEIARVNDLYRKARDAAPEPLPACVFTRGFVRVWNEAAGAAVPALADPERTAAQVVEALATDQLDAGISRADLLAHHIRYSEQCRNTAAQLDQLIDAIEGKH